MNRLLHICSRELKLLIIDPRLFALRWVGCFLVNSIFKIDRNYTYRPSKTISITFPNKLGVSYILMETFIYKIFGKIRGLERVLDIGGFIGESALQLASQNTEVYCYEASNKNFQYLTSNAAGHQNIIIKNAAVTASKDAFVFFQNDDISSTNMIQKESKVNTARVENVYIIDLLTQISFDGMKLDIEGGEYELLSCVLENNLFSFKKGIIEFHDIDQAANKKFIESFLATLETRGYTSEIIDNEGHILAKDILFNNKYCNILFYLS